MDVESGFLMALFLISFVIWALLHSWTAAVGVKAWFRRRFGETAYEGLYRLLYNLFSLVTFAPVLYFSWQLLPGRIVWQVPLPWSLLLLVVQLMGIVGLIVSLLQTDVLAFIGVCLLLLFVCLRAVSLHHLDAILRHAFLGLKLRWWLEIIGIACVAGCAGINCAWYRRRGSRIFRPSLPTEAASSDTLAAKPEQDHHQAAA